MKGLLRIKQKDHINQTQIQQVLVSLKSWVLFPCWKLKDVDLVKTSSYI